MVELMTIGISAIWLGISLYLIFMVNINRKNK